MIACERTSTVYRLLMQEIPSRLRAVDYCIIYPTLSSCWQITPLARHEGQEARVLSSDLDDMQRGLLLRFNRFALNLCKL